MSQFQQILDPAGGSLALSALVAAVPLTSLFVMLGILRVPAYRAALISLALSVVIAVAVWRMPIGQAASATAEGAFYGLFPILWILINAIWVYRLTEITGWFEVLGEKIRSISDDQRVQAILIAFCFGALLESLAGFGAPVAISAAMLMAAGMPITHTVFGHGFLLTKGEKMSKSKGNGLKPADLVRVFGVDAYRYYFMSDVQFGQDGGISLERMVQVYNADLANTWGNLCSRVLNMTKKYYDFAVPQAPAFAAENPLREISDALYAEYDACLSAVDFTGAAAAVQKLASRVNLYVEESAPWNLAKSEETADQLAAVIYNALEAIRIIALYMAPFMPNTSAEVFRRLGLGDIATVTDIESATTWGGLPSGNVVEIGDPLFPRLDVSAIDFEME